MPITPLFDKIEGVHDLRRLKPAQLPQLAYELRLALLYSVGQTGGHLGAGLGVVELTIALHYLLNTPTDRLIWDVGHQAYPHKMLTGRKQAMLSMRQAGGLAPFPKREESPFDVPRGRLPTRKYIPHEGASRENSQGSTGRRSRSPPADRAQTKSGLVPTERTRRQIDQLNACKTDHYDIKN